MMKKKFSILIFTLLFSTSCDYPNALKTFAQTDTDEALLLEAQKKIDASSWNDAIKILTQSLSIEGQKTVKAKEKLMYAYGGKCGISFFDMVDRLKNVNSTKLFEFSLQMFGGKALHNESCDKAVETLHALGEHASLRTKNQNLFAAILGLTRMSSALQNKLDTENEGDGVIDAPALDLCTNSINPYYLSDADMNRVVTGVGLVIENLAVLGPELGVGNAHSAIEAARQACETPLELPPLLNPGDYSPDLAGTQWTDLGFSTNPPSYAELGIHLPAPGDINCSVTKSSAVSPVMRRIFRRLVSSSSMGFNHCDVSAVGIIVQEPMSNPPQFKLRAQCCPNLETP